MANALTDAARKYRERNREKNREYQREYYRKHPEKVKARAKAWREANLDRDRECRAVAQKRYRLANPEKAERAHFNAYLKKRHKITASEYEAMHAAQRGCCAICGQGERAMASSGRRTMRLAVDHCHRTMRIRGLLCNSCNRGIGYFGDDPSKLQKAASYLATGGKPAL